MSDFFYLIMFMTLLMSLSLWVFSVYRMKTIGLIEFMVMFSWFYIFLRPLTIDYCSNFINKEIYFWDIDYYGFGVVFSALGVVLLQIGASFSLKRYQNISPSFSQALSNKKIIVESKKILNFSTVLFLFVLFGLVIIYGQNILPWHRAGTGATSAGLVGFEFIWPLIRILLFFIIVFSLFLFFETKKQKYLLPFLLVVLTVLIFGRRGILVGPILFFTFIYMYYLLKIKNESFLQFITPKYIVLIALLFVIIFTGKTLVSKVFFGGFVQISSSMELGSVCGLVRAGAQEFDLIWPAVISNYLNNYSMSDFIYALFGNFIPHENRLLNYEHLYSITDKLMMEHVRDTYLNLKFGISPNLYQFYFSYLGVFSLLLFLCLGYYLRVLEMKVLRRFFSSNFFFNL